MRELVVAVLLSVACGATAYGQPQSVLSPIATKVTFEDAIRIALEKNPRVFEAEQSIAHAEALLLQARTVYRPSLNGTVGVSTHWTAVTVSLNVKFSTALSACPGSCGSDPA